MTLNKIKNLKEERGFTIVELLIVIVVIAILAAIVIVAYNGITARANTSKAQANAVSVQKVVEAFNADNSMYPALAASGTNSIGTYNGSTRLPAGVTIVPDAATSPVNSTNGTSTVAYACLTSCTNSTGGRITWWSFTAPGLQYIYVGAAASGGTFVYPAT